MASTMPDMSMPTDSSSSSMSMPMSSTGMNMIFFTSTTTPLYSSMWTPTSVGSYAGTCIFLILLAISLRGLSVFSYLLEKRWADCERQRRYVVVQGRPSVAESVNADASAKKAVLVSERGSEESVRVVSREVRAVMPWRFSVDLPRAALKMVMAGVGYLLMLAVMTMNVGYFLSVLAGIFVGEIVVGRYSHADEH
ncbi:hypothetical protein MMC10_006458 [Thelotrema lepadinum]|nr:hypothetical protein [Thelotrema lepadinum]